MDINSKLLRTEILFELCFYFVKVNENETCHNEILLSDLPRTKSNEQIAKQQTSVYNNKKFDYHKIFFKNGTIENSLQ